jgi:hypothetical protein
VNNLFFHKEKNNKQWFNSLIPAEVEHALQEARVKENKHNLHKESMNNQWFNSLIPAEAEQALQEARDKENPETNETHTSRPNAIDNRQSAQPRSASRRDQSTKSPMRKENSLKSPGRQRFQVPFARDRRTDSQKAQIEEGTDFVNNSRREEDSPATMDSRRDPTSIDTSTMQDQFRARAEKKRAARQGRTGARTPRPHRPPDVHI